MKPGANNRPRMTRIGRMALGLILLALAGCAGSPPAQPESREPTAVVLPPTSLPTAAPTATPAPTVTPTAAPTATPAPQGLAGPVFARQQTVVTNDLSPDGYNWSQASPLLIDRYGSIIIPAQRHNNTDKRNLFVYSNDGGATWQDSVVFEGFIERGAAAYDPANDVIHMLWIGISPTDGVFYRRYVPIRDAEHKITGIEKTADLNMVLDKQTDGAMFYQHPILLHLPDAAFGRYGALLAVWGARNNGAGGGNEIRASMAVLGDDANAGGQAASWKAPSAASATVIGNAPQAPYTVLLANTLAGIAHPSVLRKRAGANAGDVYLFYHDGAAPGAWAFRRMRWSAAAGDWSAGLTAPTTISEGRRAGSSTGYTLNQQLGSRPVEDPARDRVYFGFANWKDDAGGDTWSFVYVDAAAGDALSPIVDVYSAGGPHSYAPAGDIAFDAASGLLVVSYVKTGTQHAFVRLYDGTAPVGEEVAAFDAAPVDIPLLAEQTRYGSPARLLMAFRDTVNHTPPYSGWFGSLVWR